jgi:hypothetical protein
MASRPELQVHRSPFNITLWPLPPDPAHTRLDWGASGISAASVGVPLSFAVMANDSFDNPCAAARGVVVTVTGGMQASDLLPFFTLSEEGYGVWSLQLFELRNAASMTFLLSASSTILTCCAAQALVLESWLCQVLTSRACSLGGLISPL